MAEEIAPIPDDATHRRRLALAAAVTAVVVALVAGGVWFAMSRGAQDGGAAEPGTLTPAEETTPAAGSVPTESVEPTSGAGSGGDESDVGSGEGGAELSAVTRLPFVAYRSGGSVWVAKDDGTERRPLYETAMGTFALSPDARTLAVVDGGRLLLIDVATGHITDAGAAEDGERPAWHADSSAVLFVRAVPDSHGVTDIMRVDRGGGSATKVAQGRAPAISAAGVVVAAPVMAAFGDSGAGTMFIVPPSGQPRTLSTRGPVLSVEVTADRVFYATSGKDAAVWSARHDGGDAKRLAGPPSGSRPFGFADLCVSPDEKHLVFAEVGDDGYSRMSAVALDGGRPVSLSVRRDTYPLCWNWDGSAVLFIEGNRIQGEPTTLMKVRPDGLGRVAVIEGAER